MKNKNHINLCLHSSWQYPTCKLIKNKFQTPGPDINIFLKQTMGGVDASQRKHQRRPSASSQLKHLSLYPLPALRRFWSYIYQTLWLYKYFQIKLLWVFGKWWEAWNGVDRSWENNCLNARPSLLSGYPDIVVSSAGWSFDNHTSWFIWNFNNNYNSMFLLLNLLNILFQESLGRQLSSLVENQW